MRVLSTSLLRVSCVAIVLFPLFSAAAFPQDKAKDPGPRPNPKTLIPDPVPGLTANEMALFNESLLRISELEGTCDTCAQQPEGQLPSDPSPTNPFSPIALINSAGIGPVFNADQCFICHTQPKIGGVSGKDNPAEIIAHREGGSNKVPSFEEVNGAFREVRFKFHPDGSRDGGVTSLFTVAGRTDAPDCTLQQPDFETEYKNQNVAFRTPLPLFGLGLIESISDTAIRENMAADQAAKKALGIEGKVNVVPNNGTISRFGWKAQNASINMFAGEAYNVEMGITNDLFPITRSEVHNCNLAYAPFDIPRITPGAYDDPLKLMPAWMMFTVFMRFVDAPHPALPVFPPNTDLHVAQMTVKRGRQKFVEVGCALCHTQSFVTPGVKNPDPNIPSTQVGPHTEALRGETVELFSDLLLHHMGATLADNVIQGNAGPDDFRTTPLWGLGQRLFFLHDGRTTDLVVAIQDHYSDAGSDGGDNPVKDKDSPSYRPSEANAVINKFNALTEEDRQALLYFLRSL